MSAFPTSILLLAHFRHPKTQSASISLICPNQQSCVIGFPAFTPWLRCCYIAHYRCRYSLRTWLAVIWKQRLPVSEILTPRANGISGQIRHPASIEQFEHSPDRSKTQNICSLGSRPMTKTEVTVSHCHKGVCAVQLPTLETDIVSKWKKFWEEEALGNKLIFLSFFSVWRQYNFAERSIIS